MSKPTDDAPDGKPVLQFRPQKRMRRGRDEGPAALADLMVPTLARMGHRTRARHMQLVNLWPEVVGDMVAEHSTAAFFARGRLTVETDSPAMGHQLHLQRQEIIDALNARLGVPVVVDIKFRLAGESR